MSDLVQKLITPVPVLLSQEHRGNSAGSLEPSHEISRDHRTG